MKGNKLSIEKVNSDKFISELKKLASAKKAESSRRFFKTGKGDYSEKDVFIGVTVPENRALCRKYMQMDLKEIEKLLKSKIHEVRHSALIMLVTRFMKGSVKVKKQVFDLYFKNVKYVNNWDLVDVSARDIVGEYLRVNNKKNKVFSLIRSKSLWEQRIGVVACAAFIRHGELDEIFEVCVQLLNHEHDLIHKACGWMLREAGMKDESRLIEFIKKYSEKMPKVMKRYAMEKLRDRF